MAEITNPSSLKIRQLQCKFTLQSGVFNQGFNSKIVDDLTINAIVTKTMSSNFTNSAQLIVYGMNKSDVAALSTLGYAPLQYEQNRVQVYAQYEGDSQSLCFDGFIVKAYADYSDPSRPMHFECQTTYQHAIDVVNSINLQGSIDLNSLYSNIASSLGFSLQNNGVNGVINNPILSGSAIDQLKQLSKQANVNCIIDNGKVQIAPKGISLTNNVLVLNSESGLLSYPTVDVYGVKFRMRYNPVLQIGQYIQLQTEVPLLKSNGYWFVYDMQSNLNNRHENWYTDVKCSYNNNFSLPS